MEQEFKLLEDGKVRWDFTQKEEEATDRDFGRVGVGGASYYRIFDNMEKAKSILDRDASETQALVDTHKADMDKNEHNLEKFTDIKELVESVGKLHNDFKDTKEILEELFKDIKDVTTISVDVLDKFTVMLKEFNKSKDYIVEEMSALNKEYNKYLSYGPAKTAYEFAKEQLEKIEEQRVMLKEL